MCTEKAKIILPWGGKLLSYCPVHANEIVTLANFMGSPIQVKKIEGDAGNCESTSELSEDEKAMNTVLSTLIGV